MKPAQQSRRFAADISYLFMLCIPLALMGLLFYTVRLHPSFHQKGIAIEVWALVTTALAGGVLYTSGRSMGHSRKFVLAFTVGCFILAFLVSGVMGAIFGA